MLSILIISTIFDITSGERSWVEQTTPNNINQACRNMPFCKKTFNISYVTVPPYSPSNTIQYFLQQHCGECAKSRVVNVFADVSEVQPESIRTSDFIYPFLGCPDDLSINGYHFIPVIRAPVAYYMTPTEDKLTLFHNLSEILPFLLVAIMIAAVAGFVCWIVETLADTGVFPKSFVHGWFEVIQLLF